MTFAAIIGWALGILAAFAVFTGLVAFGMLLWPFWREVFAMIRDR